MRFVLSALLFVFLAGAPVPAHRRFSGGGQAGPYFPPSGLNTLGRNYPGLPATVYGARGAGSNTILISPEHDLVAVWRWHDGNEAELAKRVIAAIK